jgi:hypothetical protein
MEIARKVVDSSLLDGIISLPSYLQSKKVEIAVFPAEEERQWAEMRLFEELEKGRKSAEEHGWLTAEEARAMIEKA